MEAYCYKCGRRTMSRDGTRLVHDPRRCTDETRGISWDQETGGYYEHGMMGQGGYHHPRPEPYRKCAACAGHGRTGHPRCGPICEDCNGSGERKKIMAELPCPVPFCRGSGWISHRTKCAQCGGSGKIKVMRYVQSQLSTESSHVAE